jgi:glycerol-3-phosphate dehydrogenase
MVLGRRYERVVLWSFERELAEQMEAHRENRKYREGFRLRPNVRVVSELADALEAAEVVLGAVPSMPVQVGAFAGAASLCHRRRRL